MPGPLTNFPYLQTIEQTLPGHLEVVAHEECYALLRPDSPMSTGHFVTV